MWSETANEAHLQWAVLQGDGTQCKVDGELIGGRLGALLREQRLTVAMDRLVLGT